MTELWLALGAMMLVAMGVALIPALLAGRAGDSSAGIKAVAKVYQDRCAELDADYADGRIGEAQYQELRTELQRNLLAEADSSASVAAGSNSLALAWIMALILPVSALLFYYTVELRGEPASWIAVHQQFSPAVASARVDPIQAAPVERENLFDFTRVLASSVARDGMQDSGDLYLLGTTLIELQAPRQALEVLERGYALNPDDAGVKLAYAQARILNNEGQLDAKSAALLRQVLGAEPGHRGALMLLGFAAFNSGNDDIALSAWRPLLASLPADSEPAKMLQNAIDEATQRIASATAVVQGSQAENTKHARIVVTVDLAQSLKSELGTDSSLFIFARAADGPPMPLAAVRQQTSDFPVQVVLDDTQSMVPSLKLSSFVDVLVGARISFSGNPVASVGDLEAQPHAVTLGGEPQSVSLTIDRVVE